MKIHSKLKTMNMKKLTMGLITAFLFLSFIPVQLKAVTETNKVSLATTKTVESKDVSVLIARVEKISAMDRSTMTSSEKKELRKELRSIKNDLKESSKNSANVTTSSGGIYLSVGAIIIIILLLILLL